MTAPFVYRIFVSSPGDVGREREIVARILKRVEGRLGDRVRLEGYFWEHEPMLMNRGDFQENIEEPASCDLVVCILWSRLGSRLHPGRHRREDGTPFSSGTEYEFENALAAARTKGTPDILVFRRTEPPVSPLDAEEFRTRSAQWGALNEFCRRWFTDPEAGSFTAAFHEYPDSAVFEVDFERALRKLVEERLHEGGADAGSPSPAAPRERWLSGSPYRGLAAFDIEHKPIFHGRTRAYDAVLGTLRARAVREQCPFVLIFGASGSGKSSLMRAGVMARLTRPGVIEGVDAWRHAIFRPASTRIDEDPATALARCLTAEGALPELLSPQRSVDRLAEALRNAPEKVAGYIESTLELIGERLQREGGLHRPPIQRFALGIDQLEEVFTLEQRFGPGEGEWFFRAISALARGGFVWVTATLRSDFFSRCEAFPELMALKAGAGSFHLTVPNETELDQMIRYPAESAGVGFEDHPTKGRLEARILRDAQDQPGTLPLLEYALDVLFRKGAADGVLTHADYDEIGGIEQALSQTADRAFAGLGASGQAALDRVLRGLVTLDETRDVHVRQVARRSELLRIPGAESLVDQFLAERLFIADQDDSGGTIAVAHEALLSVWPLAQDRLRSDLDFFQMRQRLRRSMRQWGDQGRESDYLLPAGRPLTEAIELFELHNSDLSEVEKEYICASRQRAEESERRRGRLRRTVLLGLSLLAVLALIGAGLATWKWQDAEAQKQTARQERNRAVTAREKAERTLEYLQYDLPALVAPYGMHDVAEKVRSEIQNYYRGLDDADGNRNALYNRAMVSLDRATGLQADGRVEEAGRHFREAHELVVELRELDPNLAAYRQAEVAVKLAWSQNEQSLGNEDAANHLLANADRLAQEMGGGTGDSRFRLISRNVSATRAAVAWSQRRIAEALKHATRAAGMSKSLFEFEPGAFKHAVAYFEDHRLLATLLVEAERAEEAEEIILLVLEEARNRADNEPVNVFWLRKLIELETTRGAILQALGDDTGIEDNLRRRIAAQEAIADLNPNLLTKPAQLAKDRIELAELLRADDRAAEALPLLESNLRHFVDRVANALDVPTYRIRATFQDSYAETLVELGRVAEAASNRREVAQACELWLRAEPDDPAAVFASAKSLEKLGRTLKSLGAESEARDVLSEAVAILKRGPAPADGGGHDDLLRMIEQLLREGSAGGSQ